MAEDQKKAQQRGQLYIGPLVGVLVFFLTLTNAYRMAELVTYDLRFDFRNRLFGMPSVNRHLGTIDIDLLSLGTEGRHGDWTRDKYIEVVRLLSDYGARMVGFDVFFIEPSTKLISEAQIEALDSIDPESIAELLSRSDYDEMFRQTLAEAGNVYLAQTIVVPQEDDRSLDVTELVSLLEPRNADQEAALEVIRQRAPRLMVNPDESTLWRGINFDPPLRLLRDATRGFAYAQTTKDADGARRRYPLVYQYEDIVFPSMALAMVCDFLQVPTSAVEIWPGDFVRLPDARLEDGTIRDVEIPIDDDGSMSVNWVGRWEESFVHYPHVALRDAAVRRRQQRILDLIKSIAAADPMMRSPRKMLTALSQTEFTDRDANVNGIQAWIRASGIEAGLRGDPELTAAEFWRSKGLPDPGEDALGLFDQIERTNRVAEVFEGDPDISFEQLRAALPDEDADDLRQCYYFVHPILVDGRIPASARPLYFYPYIRYQGGLLTPDDIRGKILMYGLTAPGTTDLSVTPVQGNYPMVGIYPNVLNTILEGIFIERLPAWVNATLIMALGVFLSLVIPRLRVLNGAVLVAAIVVLYGLGCFFAFVFVGHWVEVVAPVLTLVGGYLALTVYGYVMKEREKDFVQGAFGHYLSPAVVDQIMNNPDMINQLGGEERVMTAFFSDVASFSTISECLTPVELVHFINDYLSEMCDIIEEYGGTIDKFEGDAIVAIFGAPEHYEDHAVRACMSSIDQQRKLVELRARWQRDNSLPTALRDLRDHWEKQGRVFAHVRIGISAGPMVVGNMGSRTRTDYTMMGDNVNLAARFESGQKIYGTAIMVNDVIQEAIADLTEHRKLDEIQVVGKEKPVIAYEIMERKGELSPERYQVLELYNRGLASYERFEFVEAARIFGQALEIDPSDGPSALYVDRCEEFADNPPEDLVFRAESK